jgi:hypothetical protein
MNKDIYENTAIQFLFDTATSFSIVKAVPQKKPLWAKKGEKHGLHYAVTLKNKNGEYVFDFWNSTAKAELLDHAIYCKDNGTNNQRGDILKKLLKENKITTNPIIMTGKTLVETVDQLIQPSPYDVLACLYTIDNDTFEDFCFNYGHDDDSIIVEKTYRACLDQDRMLRKLFDREQLEKLQNIN